MATRSFAKVSPVSSGPRAPLPLPAAEPLPVPAGLGARLEAMGAVVAASALEAIGAYLGLLLAMNEQMNLTAIRDPDAAWTRHVLDALSVLPALQGLAAGARVADVGSGGGIPGLPLAIARPDVSFTLVESTQKKASFLVAASGALGLSNVVVRAERAEQLAAGALRSSFDAVTARAVARLAALVPLTVPLLRPGGCAVLIKGERAGEELAESASVLRTHRCVHERTIETPTGRLVVLRRRA